MSSGHRWAGTLAALALLAAGCGSGSSANEAPPPPAARGATVPVTMKELEFSPTAIQAKVGQRVSWTNEDSSPHNVTYVSGPRFSSSRPVLAPGAKFSISLTQPGTIHYYCSIHPWMKATIIVAP